MRQKTYVLAKAILERKDLLFGNNDNNSLKPQSMKEKEDAWEAVRNEMIEQGFTNFERKSWRDVRNHDWQYLRRSAMAKYEHNQKGPGEPIQYSEVDKLVFEIMGNEVSSSSLRQQYDLFDGTTASQNNSFGWLKYDEQQQNDAVDSTMFSFSQAAHLAAAENGHNATQQSLDNGNSGKRHLNSFLDNAMAAGASSTSAALNRKESWEANSPAVSPIADGKHFLYSSSPAREKNVHDSIAAMNQAELLQSIMASSQLVRTTQQQKQSCQAKEKCEINNFAQPSVSAGLISSSSAASIRKRPHSTSSDGTKSADEEQLIEAKIRLISLQTKREELVVQQEKCKLIQEEAKVRQEKAKAELLELQLKAERAKAANYSNGNRA